MKSKFKKGLIIGLAVFAIIFTGSAAINMAVNNVFADDIKVWSEITLEGEYLQGDDFVIPTRTLSSGETVVDAVAIVTYPNGITKTGESIKLDLPGKYTLTYTAMLSDKVYKITEEFIVQYRMVSFTKDETNVVYGSHSLASTVNGLVVRLAEGDKLTFNQTVDLNKLTVADSLFEFFVTADNPGNLDFAQLWIQFTDIENSENYFRVRYIHTQSSTGGPFSYVMGAGNGQQMSGMEGSKLHVENVWGAWLRHSFVSYYDEINTEVGETRPNIRYDLQTKELFSGSTFVIDFDNPNHFEKLWNGFESNKVQISVWAEDYSTSSANFVITEVAGIDLEKTTMEESEPPVINIDTEYSEYGMPIAKVGCEYTIPNASAYDVYTGSCDVNISVYYNYTSKPSTVAINNGKFVVNYPGEYAIVYSSVDYMGNKAQKILWIRSFNELEPINVILNSDFPSSICAGETFEIPTYAVFGGSGNKTVKIYVNDGSTEQELNGLTYRPNVVGKHVFKYVVTDYINQTYVHEVEINVESGDSPVFVDVPNLPDYFICGASYKLPDLYANDYTSGKLVRRLATVIVSDANGDKIIDSNTDYYPAVNKNFDKIIVSYNIDNVSYVKEIPAVLAKDDDGVYVGNYFDLNGATLELGDLNSTIVATDSNGSWKFANALIAEGIEVVIDAVPDNSKFDGIKISFTDSLDSGISIDVGLYKNGKETTVMFNDGQQFNLAATGFSSESSSSNFKIAYKNKSVTVNGSGLEIKAYKNGEKFNGFPSRKIYVSVEFINATIGASYKISEINGQKVTTTTLDRVAPKVVILGATGGTFKLDETTVLPLAMASDTLDPNITFSMRVLSPSLKVVTSIDGIVLDGVDPTRAYEIKFTEYGQYKVYYQAKDTFSGRTTNLTYALNVDDDQGPTIIFETEFKTQVKVGETIIIPNFSVTDNLDASTDVEVYSFCLTASGELVALNNSNSIVAIQTGVYQIRILAIDTNGNITMCRVNVAVVD